MWVMLRITCTYDLRMYVFDVIHVFSMSSDELATLHDVFQTLQPDHRMQKATYMLQYLD